MRKIIKILYICLTFVTIPAFADDTECLGFKVYPKIDVLVPNWRKEVVQPLKSMDLLHGNVVATLTEKYSISAHPEYVDNGICVVLDRVTATIGYSDFSVQIDSRHIPESCAYNAILEHEDEHIRAHLAVISNNESEIKRAVSSAANSIVPIFFKTQNDADSALDEFNADIQNNPEIILLKQKLKAEEEIRNKKVDQNEDSHRLDKCNL